MPSLSALFFTLGSLPFAEMPYIVLVLCDLVVDGFGNLTT